MGTMKMAGSGDKDLTVNIPNVDIPNAASTSGKGPIKMTGDGDKDVQGVNDGNPIVNKGIIDTGSSGKGKIDFAGNV